MKSKILNLNGRPYTDLSPGTPEEDPAFVAAVRENLFHALCWRQMKSYFIEIPKQDPDLTGMASSILRIMEDIEAELTIPSDKEPDK